MDEKKDPHHPWLIFTPAFASCQTSWQGGPECGKAKPDGLQPFLDDRDF
jgi:hypothetical protein